VFLTRPAAEGGQRRETLVGFALVDEDAGDGPLRPSAPR